MMKNRRQFVVGGALAGLGLTFTKLGEGIAFAADTKAKKASGPHADLVASVTECLKTGEACAAHCQKQLAAGNTMFAKCAQATDEMLTLCRSMLHLASTGSALSPKLAAVCAEACKSCADACGEHKAHFSQGMHLECKACMESCEACEKDCKKIQA
jgi:Cys-rich four helix bundle protein (predicted Tat secretion target)